MAAVKFTVSRGKPQIKDIAQAPGTGIAGSDAIELNIDQTRMSKGDALAMMDALRDKVFASKWPLA